MSRRRGAPERREVRAIEDLAPNPRNARVIGDREAKALAVSIEEFGDIAGITFNLRTGHLVAGHQRVAKIQEVGGKLVRDGAGAYLEHPNTRERFPIRFVDWDEAKELRALATGNNPHTQGTWSPEAATILAPLAQMELAKDLRLDALLKELPRAAGHVEEDGPAPAPPTRPHSKPGDLWILGPHRLLCGDATDPAHVRELLGGQAPPVLMTTDPPYGVQYDPDWRNRVELGKGKGYGKSVTGDVANDDQVDWAAALALFPGDVMYVWHAGIYAAEVADQVRRVGFEIRAQIIWAKQHLVLSRGAYHWKHEPCWCAARKGTSPAWYHWRHEDAQYAVRKGSTAKWSGARDQTTLWEVANLNPMGGEDRAQVTGHATQKPIELFAIPIRNHTRDGEAIYDPFVGSGSCVVAAEQLGRRCYGLDIDPRYVDVVVLRWQRLTGQTALHAETGRPFGGLRK